MPKAAVILPFVLTQTTSAPTGDDFLDTSYFAGFPGVGGAAAVVDDEKLDTENNVCGRAGNLLNIERVERIVTAGLVGAV